MSRVFPCAVALAAMMAAGPAAAQSQAEICAMLAPAMLQASDAMAEMSGALTALDLAPLLPRLSGEVRAEVVALDAQKLVLMPVLEAYLDQLEVTAMVLRRCAR